MNGKVSGNGNGNILMGMGGNGSMNFISAHLYPIVRTGEERSAGMEENKMGKGLFYWRYWDQRA